MQHSRHGALAEYVCSMLGQWSWSFTISQCIGKNTTNHHVAVAQRKGCLFITLRKPDLSLGWKGSGKRGGRILIHGSFLERSTNKALPRHHGLSISFPKLTLKINFTHWKHRLNPILTVFLYNWTNTRTRVLKNLTFPNYEIGKGQYAFYPN